jgi:NAD(P)H-flavin reductase
MSAARTLEDIHATDRRIALIGGGIGIAPLVYLAAELPSRSFDFYAGFRSRPYGLDGLQSRAIVITTEDGSAGHTGRIPDFFESAKYGAVYACGPEPMLRAVAAACKATRTPALLSLERRMACGVGACLGCTVHTLSGNRRCCADGPIFNAEEICFDD